VIVTNTAVRQNVHELEGTIDTFLKAILATPKAAAPPNPGAHVGGSIRAIKTPKAAVSSSLKVYTGPQGGKYILKSGKKVYLKK
jgi:hypothetical protein